MKRMSRKSGMIWTMGCACVCVATAIFFIVSGKMSLVVACVAAAATNLFCWNVWRNEEAP